jgi:hypothetical protein
MYLTLLSKEIPDGNNRLETIIGIWSVGGSACFVDDQLLKIRKKVGILGWPRYVFITDML